MTLKLIVAVAADEVPKGLMSEATEDEILMFGHPDGHALGLDSNKNATVGRVATIKTTRVKLRARVREVCAHLGFNQTYADSLFSLTARAAIGLDVATLVRIDGHASSIEPGADWGTWWAIVDAGVDSDGDANVYQFIIEAPDQVVAEKMILCYGYETDRVHDIDDDLDTGQITWDTEILLDREPLTMTGHWNRLRYTGDTGMYVYVNDDGTTAPV